MPLYTENTDFDITAKPEVLGSLGETPYETQEIDLSSAEALPEGWTIKLDDLKVSVEGNYQTESKADEPADELWYFQMVRKQEDMHLHRLRQREITGSM